MQISSYMAGLYVDDGLLHGIILHMPAGYTTLHWDLLAGLEQRIAPWCALCLGIE